jgi:hypothetical protein
MSAVLQQTDPMVELSRLHAALDALQAWDCTGMSDSAMLAFWSEFERLRRRLPTIEHQLIVEAEARGLAFTYQARGLAALLRGLLRIDPAEARARVKAADAGGTRRALTGQSLPAAYPAVAAAQAAGDISDRHAQIVVSTIEKLPEAIQLEHGEQIETELVEHARAFDPKGLAKIAERIKYCYDPDGRLEDVDYWAKQRGFTIKQRVDGSARWTVDATAELNELMLTHLDPLAAPRPALEGVKDPRTAEQRRHDALLEILQLNLRAQVLPSAGGVTSTIVMTMTAEEFEQRKGLATTGHGALLPVREAMRIAAGEYRLMNVVIDKTKGITAYSSIQRFHTESQRLAMIAADGPGCTFPHCPLPAAWCQADHTIDHARGGPTDVAHGVLACRYHNNDAKKQGWQSVRINGRAAWIPPRWIDPEQTPQYNSLHNPNPPP